MLITVDMRSRTPIYEQLITGIRTQATQGILAPDEQLPSVRQLAAELAINPNTIQKAYAELERQNVIYAQPGRGIFVCPDIRSFAEKEQKRQTVLLEKQITEARNAGVSEETLHTLVTSVYHTKGESDT